MPGAISSGRPADGASRVVPRRGPRRWLLALLPLLGALLLVGAALFYTSVKPLLYTSESLVAVFPEDPALNVSAPLTSIWVEIGNSDMVLDRVARELGASREALAQGLTVSDSADATLISIRAQTSDPSVSAEWANAAALALLEQGNTEQVPGYFLEQVTDAQPAQSADRSTGNLLIAGAAVIGALTGAAAAQLLSTRHRRRTAKSLR